MGFSIHPSDKKPAAALANFGENAATTRAWLKETETEVLLEDNNRFFIDASVLFPTEIRKPAVFEARNLPHWVRLDGATGVISGKVPEAASVFGAEAVEIAVTDCKGSLFQTNARLVARNLAPIAGATIHDREFFENTNAEMHLGPMFDLDLTGADLTILSVSGLSQGLYFDPENTRIAGCPLKETAAPMPNVVTVTTKATDGVIDRQHFLMKISAQEAVEDVEVTVASVLKNSEIVGDWHDCTVNPSDSLKDYSFAEEQLYLATSGLILQQKAAREAASADERLDRITLDALMRQNTLYLEFQSQLDEQRDGKIVAASIDGLNGERLPSWMTQIREDFIRANPPVDVSHIDVELNVEVISGQKLVKPVRINIQKWLFGQPFSAPNSGNSPRDTYINSIKRIARKECKERCFHG